MRKGFTAAVRRAGIEDFHFHDLRHCFASYLVMRGASMKEVQELLGHKTMTMTLRYAHLGQEQKKQAVGLLNGLAPCVKSTMSQNCHKLVALQKRVGNSDPEILSFQEVTPSLPQ
jgi:hypothetical protein